MATGQVDAEQAVLNMLHRYKLLTMDELLISGQPDFSWAQMFLAIDRLSRQKLILLYRTGSTYHVALSRRAWAVVQTCRQKRIGRSSENIRYPYSRGPL